MTIPDRQRAIDAAYRLADHHAWQAVTHLTRGLDDDARELAWTARADDLEARQLAREVRTP